MAEYDQVAVSRSLMVSAARRTALTDRVLLAAQRSWRGLGDWRGEDVDRFVTRTLPLIQAGQVAMGALTDAFIANSLTEIGGTRVRPLGLKRSSVTELRPLPSAEVLRRPFVETWRALQGGSSFSDALVLGSNRLTTLIEDDLTLAYRHATRESYQRHGIERYRRVIRPELSKTGTCGLCVAAADQVYDSVDLLPVHGHCHCKTLPIVGDRDPARVLNDQDTAELYANAVGQTETGARDELSAVRFMDEDGLAKLRIKPGERGGYANPRLQLDGSASRLAIAADYAVRQHGELGPVLVFAADRFTGPKAIPGRAGEAARAALTNYEVVQGEVLSSRAA